MGPLTLHHLRRPRTGKPGNHLSYKPIVKVGLSEDRPEPVHTIIKGTEGYLNNIDELTPLALSPFESDL